MPKVRSDYYLVPQKSWIMHGGGEARSKHSKSAHAWCKRQASRLARRVGKALTAEQM